MATTLAAGCVYAEEEEGVIVVGFADRKYGTETYLMMQRALRPSPEDRDLGLDRVYLEWCGQGQSTYGGIVDHLLEREAMTLRLSAKTAQALRTDQTIEIAFEMNDEDFLKLEKGLLILFDA